MRVSLNVCALFLVAVFLGGCCTEQVFFQASAVSMTKNSIEGVLKEGKPVNTQFCQGDTPVSGGDSHEVGLMDEVILKAQKSAGNAPAIMNARFYTSCSCVVLKGNAALASAGGGKADDDSGDAPKKKPRNKGGKKKG